MKAGLAPKVWHRMASPGEGEGGALICYHSPPLVWLLGMFGCPSVIHHSPARPFSYFLGSLPAAPH